jgi:hypothetical protein
MTNTSIEAMGHGYSWKGFWVSTRRLKETESQTSSTSPKDEYMNLSDLRDFFEFTL